MLLRLKFSAILCAIGVLTISVSATTIVLGFSKNKVVIAADSRLTNEDGTHQDTSCKIAALNDRFLFTTSGRAIDVTNHKLGWDVAQFARIALNDVLKKRMDPTRTPERPFAGDVADLWQDLVGQSISNNIRATEFARLKPKETFVNGMFFGITPSGNIQGAFAALARSADLGYMIESPPLTTYDPSDKITFAQQGGEDQLFLEFTHATTRRARAELAATNELAKKWPPAEADVRVAMRLVELIIKYDTDHYVGGPIDAVELDKGGTIRWIQRKSNCKD